MREHGLMLYANIISKVYYCVFNLIFLLYIIHNPYFRFW